MSWGHDIVNSLIFLSVPWRASWLDWLSCPGTALPQQCTPDKVLPCAEHESCTTVSSLSSYEPNRGHSLGSAMTRVFDKARDLYLAQQQQEEQTVSQNELLDHIVDGRIPLLSFEANEADSLSRCCFSLFPLAPSCIPHGALTRGQIHENASANEDSICISEAHVASIHVSRRK